MGFVNYTKCFSDWKSSIMFNNFDSKDTFPNRNIKIKYIEIP